MDFNDTPQEATFRAEVRHWLTANAQAYAKPWAKDVSVDEFIARARDWQRRKAEAGYAAISWPKEMGGLNGTPMQEVIYAEEEKHYYAPVGPFVHIGTALVVPTIRTHGTPEQIAQYTRSTLFGEYLWCQLFSEPVAGSDLAALRTKAVREGDEWVVNGQKVWTSWAHKADFGILIARTDFDAPKHKGLTFFIIDMKTPGVEVRPIRQISGGSEFNEVFLTDVRIPDANRLGPVGAGWKVTMTTLMNERVSVGGESSELPDVMDVLRVLQRKIGSGDPRLQLYAPRLAQLYAQEQGLRYFRFRILTQLSRGETPSPVVAMSKLVYANLLQDLSALALEIDGIDGVLEYEGQDAGREKMIHGYYWASALRIAGGTDEILKNQIAERVMGLPGDLRIDKDVAFSQLSAGGR